MERILLSTLPASSTPPLTNPMMFMAGPRQVGKTFLAKTTQFPYFNWDTTETKKSFIKDPYFFRSGSPWVIFDEIHKRRDWKKLMKGYFDSPDRAENFLVTCSGRFDLAQRGGDSLQGRYDLYHLMPVTYREYIGIPKNSSLRAPNFLLFEPSSTSDSDAFLLQFGGFPEPLIKGSERFLNKWQDLYIQRLVREDIRDFSRIIETDKLEMLARILPDRVRAPLSHKALSEDVDASRDSIKTWLRLFETLYLGFQLTPWTKKIHRTVKKEKKWYFFQWTFCDDAASRFENYVATQLYSLCQMWRDAGLGVFELYYLRDQDRREIDFVITKSLKPVALIEAKLTETSWHTGLDYYARKLDVPAFIVTANGPTRRVAANKWIVPMARFLDAIS